MKTKLPPGTGEAERSPMFPAAAMRKREVSQYLGMSPRWVDLATARGDLQAIKLGRSSRWLRADIDAYLDRQKGSK